MTNSLTHVRHGFGSARPVVYNPVSKWDSVKVVFGAAEVERHAFSAAAFHIEARIGDSVVDLETSDPSHGAAMRNSILVYMSEVDAPYRKSLDVVATSLEEPSGKPYRKRNAGIRDSFGNTR